jgi:adenylate cyclase
MPLFKQLQLGGDRVVEFPKLTITSADRRQMVCPLNSGVTWKVGRGRNNTVVLADDAASRRHAIIQRTEMGEYFLMDAGSRNGTFIRGSRVSTPVLLNDGDEITIGSYKLVFANPLAAMAPESTNGAADTQTTGTRMLFSAQLVTVLVIDIRGFTTLTQQVEQEVLCKFISRWFSDASGIFRARGSWALKYIGDAVMAVWLHERGQERSQLLAVLAGVAEIASMNSPERYFLPVPVSFGAGLTTGTASVGNAGSGDLTEFTAFGDAVNAAFRIEAGTRKLGADLAIGKRSVEILGGPESVSPPLQAHSIELKGYDQPARVWTGSFSDLRELLAQAGQEKRDADYKMTGYL